MSPLRANEIHAVEATTLRTRVSSLLIKLPGDKPVVAFFLQTVDACVLHLDVPLVDTP
jgi:hypothetical protein